MSTAPTPARPSELLAGFLAVLAIVASGLALAYEPIKVIPFAGVLALIATVMAPRNSRLPLIAVFIVGICFFVGMTIAVTTNHKLY
jgi:hypothetical protein